mmetsp:Transcript_32663/g.28921  ORF Transcript_32663/g.28921 Transcript_32663/m.28921 type:complete len:114 (-) Transcript_32663:117-458(-)
MRIPSPFKNKIAANLVNFPMVQNSIKNLEFNNLRKRDHDQIYSEEPKDQNSNNSDDENNQPSDSSLSKFKRAKRKELEAEKDPDSFIPKLQTIKKKTFMRSLASNIGLGQLNP